MSGHLYHNCLASPLHRQSRSTSSCVLLWDISVRTPACVCTQHARARHPHVLTWDPMSRHSSGTCSFTFDTSWHSFLILFTARILFHGKGEPQLVSSLMMSIEIFFVCCNKKRYGERSCTHARPLNIGEILRVELLGYGH